MQYSLYIPLAFPNIYNAVLLSLLMYMYCTERFLH